MTMPASTRTRVVVLLTSIVMALVILLAGAVVAEADDPSDPAPVAFVDHTVRSGDTLWDIAAAHVTPGDDVRVLIEDIKHHNGLPTSVIVPGQVLHIPVG